VYPFEGARLEDNVHVYFLCRAEWKPDDAANTEMLEDTAYILKAVRDRRAVLPRRVQRRPYSAEQDQ
jgi:hypothetical protein